MGDLDMALKGLGPAGVAELLKLALPPGVQAEIGPAAERNSEVRAIYRRVDNLYPARIAGQAALIHVEFLDRARGKEEIGKIHKRGLLVYIAEEIPVATLIGCAAPSPWGHVPADQHEVRIGDWPVFTHRFLVVRLWEIDPDWLLSRSPSLAPLVALSARATEADVEKAARQLRRSRVRDKEPLLAGLALLASRRFPMDLIRAIITEEELMRNPLLERVRRKLREQIREEERKRADRAARRKVLKEGREEGRLEGLRESIRQVLRHRFGALPQAIDVRLDAETELENLVALLGRAMDAGSIEEIFDGRA